MNHDILIGQFDAAVWAREFAAAIIEHPGIPGDEGTMIGWFANAIMAGYDKKAEQVRAEVAQLRKERDEGERHVVQAMEMRDEALALLRECEPWCHLANGLNRKADASMVPQFAREDIKDTGVKHAPDCPGCRARALIEGNDVVQSRRGSTGFVIDRREGPR